MPWRLASRASVQLQRPLRRSKAAGNIFARTAASYDVALTLAPPQSVVTWGYADAGGDASTVLDALNGTFIEVYSTNTAFAALRGDGRLITWGSADYGGSSSTVSSLLNSGVETVYSGKYAFVAVKVTGEALAWGKSVSGGDYSTVATALTNVNTVVSASSSLQSTGAFAALKNDGR